MVGGTSSAYFACPRSLSVERGSLINAAILTLESNETAAAAIDGGYFLATLFDYHSSVRNGEAGRPSRL